jgi:hypothetical protein
MIAGTAASVSDDLSLFICDEGSCARLAAVDAQEIAAQACSVNLRPASLRPGGLGRGCAVTRRGRSWFAYRHFLCANRLAVGAVAADLRASDQNLKTEVRFHLAADALQGLAEKFFDTPTAQAYDVSVLLFHSRLVVMLLAIEMHQIKLVYQASGFQHLQRAVNSDAIQLRIFFFSEMVKTFGIQVLARFVDQIEQDLALACEANPLLLQRLFDAGRHAFRIQERSHRKQFRESAA